MPYTENFSLDVQRQLPGNVLVDVAYVGNSAHQINKGGGGDYNYNQLPLSTLQQYGSALQQQVPNPFFGIITTGPEAAATVPRSDLVAPYPQFQSIVIEYPTGGFELYDALQIKVQKRYRSGINLLLSFNGQKQIDNYSDIAVVGQAAGVQDIYNPAGEKSISANDISRSLVVSGSYALPFGHGQRFGAHWSTLLDLAAGGWQLNGIETYHTGFPLALSANDVSDSGHNTERPNTNGMNPKLSGPVIGRLKQYFNTADFSQPAPFTFGNATRTLANVRTPSYYNLDASLFKNIHLHDSMELELRAEAFNAFNQVIFNGPNTGLLSGQFGVISSQANLPRELQFAAKFIF